MDDVEARRSFFHELGSAVAAFEVALRDESPTTKGETRDGVPVWVEHPPRVVGYPESGRLGRAIVERFGDLLAANAWGVLATAPGRALWGWVRAARARGELAGAVAVAAWFRQAPSAANWAEASSAAVELGDLDHAASFLGRWLIESVTNPWLHSVDTARLTGWFDALPGLEARLGAGPFAPLLAAARGGTLERREADIAGGACTPIALCLDPRLQLPERFWSLLFPADPARILDTLEDPPTSSAAFWFAADAREPGAWPLGRPETRVVLLLEVLVGLGHVERVAAELSARSPRLAVIALLTGHPRLVDAAERALEAPGAGAALDRLRRPRPSLDDILAAADLGAGAPRFLDALADAIDVYSLTFHQGDVLLDPAALFPGLDRANPGKLAYFFARDLARFPRLDALAAAWGERPAKRIGGSGMLYTKCFLYRTAVIAAVLAVVAAPDPPRVERLRTLLERLDVEIQYFQSGSAEGFCNDTLRMTQRLLKPRIRAAPKPRRTQKP